MEKVRDAVTMTYLCRLDNTPDRKAHWLRVLAENITAAYPGQARVPNIRLKQVQHLGKLAYMFKQSVNRVRITLVPDDSSKMVSILVYDLPTTDVTMPFKPRYSHTPTIERVFNYVKDIDAMTEFCVHHLSKDTPHSTGQFSRIPITSFRARLSPTLFYSSLIKKATYTEEGKWRIYCEDGEIFFADAETIGGPKPAPGYYFVFKNEFQAEVVTYHDHMRYYAYGE